MSNRTAYVSQNVVYRALDGVSDMAAIVTTLEPEGRVTLTVFPPRSNPQFYSRITYSHRACAADAAPGTCFPAH